MRPLPLGHAPGVVGHLLRLRRARSCRCHRQPCGAG